VAIIDTGVNIYEDYYKNIWVNEDEIPNDNVDNDNNGYIDDIYGWNFCDNTNCLYTNPYVEEHGDIITSVLCSNNDGYISILGGTMCNIMIVQALDSSSATGEVSDVISAIKYAEENGATICNLSFSTYNASDELRKVMTESKMLFVVSAGNEGEELSRDYLTYPTGWELSNVISVGSVRCDGELSCESNYSSQYVDVLAPGADIVGYDNNGIICSESGTSMATALVTGLAAMVYSCSSENLSAIQIKKIICSNVKTNEKYRKLSKYNGIINYSKTLMNLN
jgi:subtilisin family serine protease